MKTSNTTLCVTMLALVLAAASQPARAGGKEKYLVGGIVGGYILNEALHHDHQSRSRTRSSYTTVRRSAPVCATRVVRVQPSRSTYRVSQPTGHYETRWERVWVRSYRQKTVLPCGTVEIREVPAHYENIPTQVWVEDRGYRDRDRRTSRVGFRHGR